jgi:predicted benzoate:H+ symporter BenE
MGSGKWALRLTGYGFAQNPMGLWCRLFKFTPPAIKSAVAASCLVVFGFALVIVICTHPDTVLISLRYYFNIKTMLKQYD